jgi:hypothetical protein
VERICAEGALLVHFVDVAHLSSVRTLPYLTAWAERYEGLGLSIAAVNSPRFPFTADATKLAAAIARLGIRFPVAVDSRYEVWHAYGPQGWPSLFLWGPGGALRWFHFGEGEYVATEAAIQEELDPNGEPPEPLAPLRDSDVPGAKVMPPSDEVFPGGSETEPWHGGPIELDYAAGGAHASVTGAGRLLVSIDGGEAREIGVALPGLVELAAHPKHESHHLRLEAGDGVDLYSISFSPGMP